MWLELLRFSSDRESTCGVLFNATKGRKCLAYTLEDQYQESKIYGETRIPMGIYDITLRAEGGYHDKYKKRYGSMHKGMLWLRNVEDFKYIYIHTGNSDDHTKGCILVGYHSLLNVDDGKGFLTMSRDAYTDIYPQIADAILSGEGVRIKVMDYDFVDRYA